MLSVSSWRPMPPPVRTQAETDGQFLHAHIRADQHQVGDVHTADQQHEPDRRL